MRLDDFNVSSIKTANKMIIEIVNVADKIKGIIYPKKVTGLIKITSYYIIHLKLVS